MSGGEWWRGLPGIDPRDYEWLAKFGNGNAPATPDICLCFAYFNDEQLGPFRTAREAQRALDQKLAELEAQGGVDLLAANPSMSVVFVDPATVHVPSEEKLN